MGRVNSFLKILAIFAVTLASTENINAEVTQVYFGVRVVYDREIYKSIKDVYGHEPFNQPGVPDDYFAAFLTAVQLRFRNRERLAVNISLVNSTLLDDHIAREIFTTSPGYYETVSGTEAMKKIKEEVSNSTYKYTGGTAVFFVTTKSILSSSGSGEWNGELETGGVCNFNSSIGLVTDDGKTFSGVQSMAEQIAVLLGASLKSNCSKRKEHYPPSVFDGDQSIISSCNEQEIVNFLSETNKDCLKTPLKEISKSLPVLPAVYNNNTGYDACTAGTTAQWREVRLCKVGDRNSKWTRTCRLDCCEYNSRFTRNGRGIHITGKKMADGSPCGANQICIFGKCENMTLSTAAVESRNIK